MILFQGSLLSWSMALCAGSVRRHILMNIIKRDERRFPFRREKEEHEKYGQRECDERHCIFHGNFSFRQNSRLILIVHNS
jgi:hypothetical protein